MEQDEFNQFICELTYQLSTHKKMAHQEIVDILLMAKTYQSLNTQKIIMKAIEELNKP